MVAFRSPTGSRSLDALLYSRLATLKRSSSSLLAACTIRSRGLVIECSRESRSASGCGEPCWPAWRPTISGSTSSRSVSTSTGSNVSWVASDTIGNIITRVQTNRCSALAERRGFRLQLNDPIMCGRPPSPALTRPARGGCGSFGPSNDIECGESRTLTGANRARSDTECGDSTGKCPEPSRRSLRSSG